jgi:alanine-glyoxylate transaminase/serine-glyoxylate transaminase/serine-pyruvate transaminase
MLNYHLMIPGPVELEPEILTEMGAQIVAHYGKEWTDYYNETLGLLKQVFQTNGDIFTIPGSGSAGLDAAIGSTVGNDDKILVLSNGFFGDRLADIAQSYSSKVVIQRSNPTIPIDPDRLLATLQKDRSIKAVAAVHCETSSGLLNPVKELARVCQKEGVIFIVDAISSLGGTELQMDEWGIGICVSASQKCLEGPPGLALVAVGKAAWPLIEQKNTPGWYLNLRVWKDFAQRWSDWHPYPITMAVPALRGLRKGLERILGEGLKQRFERHRRVANLVRIGLANLGFELLIPADATSPTVTAAKGNEILSADAIVSKLKERYKIQIAGGIGEFKGQIFRIGHMGPQAQEEKIIPLLYAIESLLRDSGLAIEEGRFLKGWHHNETIKYHK